MNDILIVDLQRANEQNQSQVATRTTLSITYRQSTAPLDRKHWLKGMITTQTISSPADLTCEFL